MKSLEESLFQKRLREAEINAEQLYTEMKEDSNSLSTEEHEEMIKESEEYNDLNILP